jgi:tetratricopeptide (TPR) repeat protein/predicted Ser/Thr protein kinase
MFAGKYRIIEELGRGGMGVVYKAEDTKLKRHVGLKLLPPDLTRDTQAKERFILEARAASALDHPNICTIHEIDETEDGRMFIAMAYYEGETLKAKIDRGPLDIEEALDTAIQIADGLSEAHEKGIIHRDIKPSNIVVTPKGQVKVMDFGLAKLAGQAEITRPGSTVGTVAYMSPEQARGIEVDHRTDIWSLGVVLYHMLTGQRPFRGAYDQAVVYSIISEEPEPVGKIREDVPGALALIVGKALAKDPDQRYLKTEDFLADLRNLKAALEAGCVPSTPTHLIALEEALQRHGRRRIGYVAVVATALATAVVAVAIWSFLKRGTEQPFAIAQQNSVAVMPFENLTGDTEYDMWREGIPELLTTALSASRDLYVLDSRTLADIIQSMGGGESGPMEASVGLEIAAKAKVKTCILGNILKAGEKLRIQVKMLDTRSGEVIRSDLVEGGAQTDFFEMAETLSDHVKDYLEIKAFAEDPDYPLSDVLTSSVEAYRHYIEGRSLFIASDYQAAIESFTRAVEIDTNFTTAQAHMAIVFWNTGRVDEAQHWFQKAYSRKNEVPYKSQLILEAVRAGFDRKMDEVVRWYRKILEIDPQLRWVWFNIGYTYMKTQQYQEAIPNLEKALELSRQWGSTWQWVWVYYHLGTAYHKVGNPRRAVELYEEGLSLSPDNLFVIRGLATSYLAMGDTARAGVYLRQWRPGREEQGWSEARITSTIGYIYAEAGDLVKAEECYRRAVEIDPDDDRALNDLAFYLIDSDIDVDEGLRLAGRALDISPDNPGYLDTQGWGYYKQDRCEEALEVLGYAWELTPYYNHGIHSHIEAVTAALAEKK